MSGLKESSASGAIKSRGRIVTKLQTISGINSPVLGEGRVRKLSEYFTKWGEKQISRTVPKSDKISRTSVIRNTTPSQKRSRQAILTFSSTTSHPPLQPGDRLGESDSPAKRHRTIATHSLNYNQAQED